jgi:hypothetical protein
VDLFALADRRGDAAVFADAYEASELKKVGPGTLQPNEHARTGGLCSGVYAGRPFPQAGVVGGFRQGAACNLELDFSQRRFEVWYYDLDGVLIKSRDQASVLVNNRLRRTPPSAGR